MAEKIERRVGINRYVVVAVITLTIFILGVSLGFIMDNQRLKWADFKNKEQKIDYESLQWQYLFLTSAENKGEVCILLRAALEKSIADLGESLEKVQNYRKQSPINQNEFEVIERTYLIDNLKYWLYAKKTKVECGAQYLTILYFFSNDCPICPDQGIVLTYYKKKYEENLLVFPINLDFEKKETSVRILRNVYNITQLPSIVVENKKYEGLVQKEELGKIICSSFSNKSLCQQ